MNQESTAFDTVLRDSPEEFIRQWVAETASAGAAAGTANKDAHELLTALQAAVSTGASLSRAEDAAWDGVRSVLAALSQSRAAQGSMAGDTSHFVLAIKKP